MEQLLLKAVRGYGIGEHIRTDIGHSHRCLIQLAQLSFGQGGRVPSRDS